MGKQPKMSNEKPLRLACDRCHGHKLRCPRDDNGGDCNRCVKAGAQCIFSSPLRIGRPLSSEKSRSAGKIIRRKTNPETGLGTGTSKLPSNATTARPLDLVGFARLHSSVDSSANFIHNPGMTPMSLEYSGAGYGTVPHYPSALDPEEFYRGPTSSFAPAEHLVASPYQNHVFDMHPAHGSSTWTITPDTSYAGSPMLNTSTTLERSVVIDTPPITPRSRSSSPLDLPRIRPPRSTKRSCERSSIRTGRFQESAQLEIPVDFLDPALSSPVRRNPEEECILQINELQLTLFRRTTMKNMVPGEVTISAGEEFIDILQRYVKATEEIRFQSMGAPYYFSPADQHIAASAPHVGAHTLMVIFACYLRILEEVQTVLGPIQEKLQQDPVYYASDRPSSTRFHGFNAGYCVPPQDSRAGALVQVFAGLLERMERAFYMVAPRRITNSHGGSEGLEFAGGLGNAVDLLFSQAIGQQRKTKTMVRTAKHIFDSLAL